MKRYVFAVEIERDEEGIWEAEIPGPAGLRRLGSYPRRGFGFPSRLRPGILGSKVVLRRPVAAGD